MAKRKSIKAPVGLSEAVAAAYKANPTLFQEPGTRYITTGLRSLDRLLGGDQHPGLATGRWYEILGQEGAGKTTTTYRLAAAIVNQPPGKTHYYTDAGIKVEHDVPRRVLIMDYEHATDVGYLRGAIPNAVLPEFDSNGRVVNLDEANVWLHQPRTIEEAGDVIHNMVRTGEFGMVIHDSIPAMCAHEEAEKSMAENTVGVQARALGKLFRKSLATIHRMGVVVVMVNQWRDKVGVSFGDPRHAPGGKATKYYASVRMDVMGSKVTDWFEHGKTCKIKTMKNKVAGWCGEVELHIRSGWGISPEVEVVQAGLESGVIEYSPTKRSDKITIHANGRSQTLPDKADLVDWLHGDSRRVEALWKMIDAAN